MKTSIVERNAPIHKSHGGWQSRIDEVHAANAARTKEIAIHHTSRFVDENLDDIKRALEDQSRYANMSIRQSKALDRGREHAHDAARRVFRSWMVMQRVRPAVEAITKLAGGVLPLDLQEIYPEIWRVLERVDEIRRWFYSSAHTADERLRIDLSLELLPLCDEMEALVLKLYVLAKPRYDLPDLNGRALQ